MCVRKKKEGRNTENAGNEFTDNLDLTMKAMIRQKIRHEKTKLEAANSYLRGSYVLRKLDTETC